MAFGRQRDRGDEGHFVLRAAPGDAAGQFTAQVGIVHLYVAAQRVQGIALAHGLHQLLLDQPGGGVADAQLPLQGQG